MKRIFFAFLLLCLTITPPLTAQDDYEALEVNTFEPELVMQHQTAISLKKEQKSIIKKEIQKAQSHFTELQWELVAEMETLVGLVSQNQVNEQQAVIVLGKVLKLESEIKQTHLVLAIRIKNQLNPEQQNLLREIRSKIMHERRMHNDQQR